MATEMIVAIGALLTGIAGIISAIMLNRKTTAILQWRMEQVEKKLDNSHYAEKLGNIEINIAEIQKDIEYLRVREG